MSVGPKPFFVQALDALKGGDRRRAAALLGRELSEGNTTRKNLDSVARLATHIGEPGLAIEATRRALCPTSVETLLAYWTTLATFGLGLEALANVEEQDGHIKDQPAILHFRGTVLKQFGRFGEAEELFRRTLRKAPAAMQTWFALAMIKTFTRGDPDIPAMERLLRCPGAPAEARASLLYALGKASEDCGDADRAFQLYSEGARLRREEHPFDMGRYAAAAEEILLHFTKDNLNRLAPSRAEGSPTLFVTGLPRSGTTLTEQLLVGHSEVHGGAELNLFGTALFPLLGSGLQNALAYQDRTQHPDPWGEIGRDYAHLVRLQFPSSGLVVDKSLGQSALVGLLLHTLPNARIAWLRRNPEDVALSCFRTFFSTGLRWSWSLEDIAEYMLIEDRLFTHWLHLFPDRILLVPYEELVSAPELWSQRIQAHFGLSVEAGAASLPRTNRAIRTASVTQVGRPISPARVGSAAAFDRHLLPFRERYYA